MSNNTFYFSFFSLKFLFLIGGISMLPTFCLGQSFTFNTQTELNGFNPAITSVTGNIVLNSQNSSDPITDLSPLENLSQVGGKLELFFLNITSLEGLNTIEEVGGTLFINNNDLLSNLDGFYSLSSVGGDLTILFNDLLSNLDGFSNLSSVSGDLHIWSNDLLSNVDGFSDLSSIGGNLEIEFSTSLTNVDGFSNLSSINGDLWFVISDAVSNIDGFSNLSFIGGNLDVHALPLLTNVDGFSNLSSINGDFYISNNPNLSDCCILIPLLSNPDAIGGEIIIVDNSFPCNSEEEIIIENCFQFNYFISSPCPNTSNGSISIQLSTFIDTAPYQFSWENTTSGQSDSGTFTENNFTISDLAEGVYSLTITDSENNEFVEENIILAAPIFEIMEITSPEINGNANGSAEIIASGGLPPYSYEWSTGETSSMIENLTSGDYSVTLTDAEGCSIVTSIAISFITGTQQEEQNLNLDLYPNPAHDFINIRLSETAAASATELRIIDAQGRILETISGNKLREGQLRLPTRLAGVYFLRLEIDGGSVETRRFVVVQN